jgi:hypothetical protein
MPQRELMNKQAIVGRIMVARQELNDAEAEVGKVLRELTLSVRADKTMIGEALEAAFTKVKCANEDLVDLEKLIERALD